jgi:hypothetical protein
MVKTPEPNWLGRFALVQIKTGGRLEVVAAALDELEAERREI